MEKLRAFPNLPAHRMQITLGGETYRYRRYFVSRTSSWYVDIHSADGEALVLGSRLTPGTLVGGAAAQGLPFQIFVVGTEPYGRADLGVSLREYVIDADALEEVDDEDGYIVDIEDLTQT